MKKVLSLVMVLALCYALTIPTFAAGIEFVPSITAKPAPEVIAPEADAATGGVTVSVKNEKSEIVYTTIVEDLLITAVSEVQSGETDSAISEEAAEQLKIAYEQLNDTSMVVLDEIPELKHYLEVEGFNPEAAVETVVVTALFDVTVLSEELQKYLDVEGNTIDLTFEADIPEDYHVVVMVYKNDQWQMIENVVVNGDGTITCTFEHFCPVAIMTFPINDFTTSTTAPVDNGAEQTGGFAWWWILVILAVIGGGYAAVKNSKKSKATK